MAVLTSSNIVHCFLSIHYNFTSTLLTTNDTAGLGIFSWVSFAGWKTATPSILEPSHATY